MKTIVVNRRKQELGAWGEDCALDFLITRGFSLIERNHRTPEGEIDLIVGKGGLTVFVEVKTRTHNRSGYPEEAVTEEKMDHMLGSAECYLEKHPEIAEDWRVDVISVMGVINSKNPQIEWFENAS